MELINDLFSQMDMMVMTIVLLSGIFVKNFLKFWEWDVAIKTLIVSAAAVVLYVIIKVVTKSFEVGDIEKYFLTYFITTSFYEILLKKFFDSIGINPDAEDEA